MKRYITFAVLYWLIVFAVFTATLAEGKKENGITINERYECYEK